EHPVAAADGIDEYIADVKFYKDAGNQYINMVYIKDDPNADPVRQGVWSYTTTTDHNNWRGEVAFNDQDLQSWPEDTAPRIVYSPGAEKTGGGVVFSYAGANGLYFDAPWISFTFIPGPVLPPVQLQTHKLTVTVHGSGKVVSSPAGIDCRTDALTGDQTCTYDFLVGTAVALTATPINGDGYTASFTGWSGGGCSGDGACAVTMNSDISVEANFAALGTPVFALPVPAAQEAWNYMPVASPVKQPQLSACKPFAVGDLATGSLSLQVGLPPFAGAVDIYLGIQSDALAGGAFFLVDGSSNLQALTSTMTTLPAWKTNLSYTDVDEALWGSIPLSLLPPGVYHLYLAVTPTGETNFAHYYLWATYFLVQ
ncbi:MAG: hypothetical protein JRJ56_06505, partial [Deltaproteobacteria bacterium]|nr:hypothetical protein [Deltaproteobacteria bacterium]